MSPVEIMVVDDRDADRELLEMLLVHAGYRVRAVSHGGDALQEAIARPPDLVVADVVLPGMGGFELVARMREHERLATVPLLLCSAYFTPAEAAQAAMELGVAAVIPKPVQAEVLTAAVARALGIDVEPMLASPVAGSLRSLNAKLVETINEAERVNAERGALLIALTDAQEAERRRIAVEVHDDSIQTMIGLSLELQLVHRTLDDSELAARCLAMRRRVDEAVERLRVLVTGLWPPDLDTGTLTEAIARLVAASPCPAELEVNGDCRASAAAAITLYRIAQDALNNVARHARADRVDVVLSDDGGGVRLLVRDDGAGIGDAVSDPAGGHIGLAGMHQRATLAGGWLRIEGSPGQGTAVEAWVPA